MHTDQFRTLFQYHFALNHKIWDEAVSHLSEEQFMQALPYSVGSVRNQLVHMADTDLRWIEGLKGNQPPPFTNPDDFGTSLAKVQAHRQQVESVVQEFFHQLEDSFLSESFPAPAAMQNWQVLFHVLAHGVDHRAQLLVMLNQMGIETFPQDYALYLFGRR